MWLALAGNDEISDGGWYAPQQKGGGGWRLAAQRLPGGIEGM